jgi:Holliday junction DNA helicase RuvB
VRASGRITREIAEEALAFEGVDPLGLTAEDRELLRTIIHIYHGGPVGIDALAATLNEEAESLIELVEPFLLKIGLLIRTPTGRRATVAAYRHLGLGVPDPSARVA